MSILDKGATILKDSGLRLTRQRENILDLLRSHSDENLSVQQVYIYARKRWPTISMDTVYRTLETLFNLGLINQIPATRKKRRYQVKLSGKHSHYALCLHCGMYIEFDQCPVTEKFVQHFHNRFFQVISHRLEFYGICEKCRALR